MKTNIEPWVQEVVTMQAEELTLIPLPRVIAPKLRRRSEGGVELPLLRQIEGYFRLPEGEGAERRRFTRVPYGDPVAVRRMHDEEFLGPVVLGRGRDLSLWGIGLAVSEAFQPGDELILSFHPYPEQSPHIVRILGEVRHARAESEELWFIGCLFNDMLMEVDVTSTS